MPIYYCYLGRYHKYDVGISAWRSKSQVCSNICMDVTLACKMILQFANQVHMDVLIYVWTLLTRVKLVFQPANQIHMDVGCVKVLFLSVNKIYRYIRIYGSTSCSHVRWYYCLQSRLTCILEYLITSLFRRYCSISVCNETKISNITTRFRNNHFHVRS